jgi:predicted MFS family arabinose efflux permease
MVLLHGHPGNIEAAMSKGSRFRGVCYAIEGLNSFGLMFFSSYLYFYLRDRFGFQDRANLSVAALLGLIYFFCAWQGGQFGQRRGYFTALKLGLLVMMAALAVGSLLTSAAWVIVAAATVTVGQCFTWPSLEALVSEGETPARLPHAVGLYNVTWAVFGALAFFIGGTLVQANFKNLFFVPLAIQAVELGLVFWLQRHATELARDAVNRPPVTPPAPDPNRPSTARARIFLRMAWLANPCAYIAITTLIAVIPGIAAKFELTPRLAGVVCSLWCFVRLGAFVVLWFWESWHYRFRWLLAAYLLLIGTFAAILTAQNLAVLVIAQIFFGGAIGLIYYSSLFYSMDAGDTKGEHGGIHEAAIGLGNCVGPATGAAALWLAPANGSAGAWAVSGVLLLGMGGLLAIRRAR